MTSIPSATPPHVPAGPAPPTGPHLATPTPAAPEPLASYQRAMHIAATTGAVVAPALLLLPPRKLDFYTFALCGSFVVSANHLLRERTGRGIMQRIGGVGAERNGALLGNGGGGGLPAERRAAGEEVQARLRAEREARAGMELRSGSRQQQQQQRDALLSPHAVAATGPLANHEPSGQTARRHWNQVMSGLRSSGWGLGADGTARARMTGLAAASPPRGSPAGSNTSVDEAEDDDAATKGVVGVARKLWMGDEKEGWKARRMQEEREAMEEGRGYGSIILEQIWEVWNWDKRKNEDGEWVPRDGGRHE